MHEVFKLRSGEEIAFPPVVEWPPCTCGGRRKNSDTIVTHMLVVRPEIYESREDAERECKEPHYSAPDWQGSADGEATGPFMETGP